MNQVRVRALVLCASVSLAAGAILNGISVYAGGAELMLPPATVILALILGGIALFYGNQVAKFRDVTKRAQVPNMTPIFAARVAVYAQSCALSGAIILGWHLALLGFELMLFAQRGAVNPLITAVVGLATGGILLGAGLWAEDMCKIPPEDGDSIGGAVAGRQTRPDGYAARND